MIDKTLLHALGHLYSKTGTDWHLAVDHILTEPTCPTAWVYPEQDHDFSLFRCDAPTIEEAINGALEMAHRRIIENRTDIGYSVMANLKEDMFLQGLMDRKQKAPGQS